MFYRKGIFSNFRNKNKRVNYHLNEALIFRDLENIWSELKTIYNGDFKNLVYGQPELFQDGHHLSSEGQIRHLFTKSVFDTLKMLN